MTNPFLYFAYGSNNSPARLRTRTPSAEPIEAARLPGFRLVFDKWGLIALPWPIANARTRPTPWCTVVFFAFKRQTARHAMALSI